MTQVIMVRKSHTKNAPVVCALLDESRPRPNAATEAAMEEACAITAGEVEAECFGSASDVIAGLGRRRAVDGVPEGGITRMASDGWESRLSSAKMLSSFAAASPVKID